MKKVDKIHCSEKYSRYKATEYDLHLQQLTGRISIFILQQYLK